MAGKPKPKLKPTQEGSGRPSKFTLERRVAIIDDISHRVPYEFAAEANGICEETLYVWLQRGKQECKDGIESEYAVFFQDIKRAEAQKMRGHSDNIADHVEKWQADAWMLERRWHKHFSTNAGLNELNSKLDKLMDGEKKDGQERSQKDD